MRTTVTTMLAVASVCATFVHGQVDNCTELLRLSRTTSRTIEDRRQFSRTVNNVCNEIRNARSENRSLNLDLRVMGLGEGGSSEASTNSLYTKYCSDQSDESSDDRNYQQYLEGIEPGAYAAYQACTTAASNDVQFQMLTSPTRDVLELVVFHETNRPSVQADMSWSASDPVACNWESFRGDGAVEAPQRRILEANERTRLKCRRESFNTEPIREPDFVNVIRDGGNATINIPWRKYGPDNSPVQTLEEIQRNLQGEIDRLRTEMEGRPVDFGPPEGMEFDQVHQAPSGGIVTATVAATGGSMRRHICGWVASDSQSLATGQARARNALGLAQDGAHYSDGMTNISGAAISMPVREGQFWIVTQCGGGPGNSATATYFHPLE